MAERCQRCPSTDRVWCSGVDSRLWYLCVECRAKFRTWLLDMLSRAAEKRHGRR